MLSSQYFPTFGPLDTRLQAPYRPRQGEPRRHVSLMFNRKASDTGSQFKASPSREESSDPCESYRETLYTTILIGFSVEIFRRDYQDLAHLQHNCHIPSRRFNMSTPSLLLLPLEQLISSLRYRFSPRNLLSIIRFLRQKLRR